VRIPNGFLQAQVTGDIDPTALRLSLAATAARLAWLHAPGNAAYAAGPAAAPPAFPRLLDLSRLTDRQQGKVLADVAADARERPFSQREPPFRAGLLRLGRDAFRLLFATDPMRMDGWALAAITSELSARYAARSRGAGLPSPPSSLPGEGIARQNRQYWRDQRLSPAGPPRLANGDCISAAPVRRITETALGPVGAAPARAIAERLGSDAEAVMLAAFAVVLERYSGGGHAIIGVAAGHRPPGSPYTDGLPHVVPARIELGDAPSFADVVCRASRARRDALDHRDIPLGWLNAELGGPPEHLDDAWFGAVAAPLAGLRLEGAAVGLSDADEPGHQAGPGIALEGGQAVLHWPASQLDQQDGSRLAAELHKVIYVVAADPAPGAKPVDLIDLTTRGPREAAVPGRSSPRLAAPYSMVRRQAQVAPGAVAVRYGTRIVTYGELAAWSSRIGRLGRSRGAGRGQVVAIALDTGPAQIAAILGIAATGAAFTCLNAGDPEAVRRAIITATRPVCLITTATDLSRQRLQLDQVRGHPDVQPLLLEGEPTGIMGETGGWPENDPAPSSLNDPLCLVHTSGSTGRPKGIPLTHAIFAQFATWQREAFEIGPGSRVAQWAPISYDAAYTEIFAALCAGATLCLPPAGVRRDPRGMLSWLHAERITHIQMVPAFFSALTEAHAAAGDDAPLDCLEHVLLAGEVLPPQLVSAWAHQAPRPRLHNLYGPTECVLATHRELRPGEEFPRGVPIGMPIPGREALILDRRLRACPGGVIGEIYLRSDYLPGGYHDAPAQTAQAYIPDPWRSGGRLYRTGDIGYWQPDGELAFVGRADNQVKIRGNRVELEGVEALLDNSGLVRAAAAATHLYSPQDRRLVAYAVPKAGTSGPQLRAYLAARLPAAAVPDRVTLLAELPRTRTGKRDRSRLPRPEEWPTLP
jgi:amino acid adenylation domain-containing protein